MSQANKDYKEAMSKLTKEEAISVLEGEINSLIDVINRRWISVDDGLPKKENGYYISKKVIVKSRYLEIPRMDFCYYILGEDIGFSSDITHWMPLPDPPTQD